MTLTYFFFSHTELCHQKMVANNKKVKQTKLINKTKALYVAELFDLCSCFYSFCVTGTNDLRTILASCTPVQIISQILVGLINVLAYISWQQTWDMTPINPGIFINLSLSSHSDLHSCSSIRGFVRDTARMSMSRDTSCIMTHNNQPASSIQSGQ